MSGENAGVRRPEWEEGAGDESRRCWDGRDLDLDLEHAWEDRDGPGAESVPFEVTEESNSEAISAAHVLERFPIVHPDVLSFTLLCTNQSATQPDPINRSTVVIHPSVYRRFKQEEFRLSEGCRPTTQSLIDGGERKDPQKKELKSMVDTVLTVSQSIIVNSIDFEMHGSAGRRIKVTDFNVHEVSSVWMASLQ